DLPALEGRGYALHATGKADEALRMFDDVLARAPDREQTLIWAADAAAAASRLEPAEHYARRLAKSYPHLAEHHERLASVLLRRKEMGEALEAAQEALRVDPFRAETRALLAVIHAERGEPVLAQAQLDVLGLINPGYQEEMRRRLAGRLK